MGHYDSCYDAQYKEQRKGAMKDANRALRKLDLKDIQFVTLLIENLEAVKITKRLLEKLK